ncbi:UDP-N-acetylmuramoylalanine--D-glutamate ligase [Rhodanobacter thiooxydans]|uniref:UDP-N-acetylmuramoyl-L-alanine--L-glutamate ligase n=1 Tax=Rhodanobacter thiooxydans TaxID=416169 RepID=A0A154QK57_9GAMM|nr:UDP-N-acetylmuramoyl-L-alanine--D-glutamate ligase [Rhodanobacter thiooxydans]EIM02336.1 UDP-N-acetylmuramoyl-L-alanyl-D-glutamate synthetase [Rhodanobacter thiooxydans LCS2]KZC24401.1 UDP-N-acetylmuramoylalanine--D-glutamate ligase [Rhodanobacter thiooxydans]MCW0200775.1 UDP-N-acetylmuramoyl-L-alanine--D-glutamate ligase [Rhodanobacter thiooxydans]
MRIAELADRHVAIWGFGREGHAVIKALRSQLPAQALTLFCRAAEVEDARAFDPTLEIVADEPDAAALARFDVVVKSPGISAYKPALLAAQAQGTRFTSGTALWFGENPDARVIAVTGTKGKSTTSALIAHLARSSGVRTALAGNIGLPLLELLGQRADLWVIELSSFQTGEAGPLELGVVTSLYEEHLDWHGSRERYVADKLKLADAARTLLVNGLQPNLLQHTAAHPHRLLFGVPECWHVADGTIRRGAQAVFDIAQLVAPGLHNALNACAALEALEAIGMDALAAAPALATFRPLPHRLQPLGEHDGWHWVNDSISTTPLATLAALESLHGRTVTVLVGGHDRGLDWTPFVEAMRAAPAHAIVCMGANGARIEAALRKAGTACPVVRVADLAGAVAVATTHAPRGGVILLSPGAPSFDQFTDYAERGRRFATLAGFDSSGIVSIDGLGIEGTPRD